MACRCVFCSRPPTSELPFPVLVVHPKRFYSFWIWITSVKPLQLYLSVQGTQELRPFKSFRDAMRFVSSHIFLHNCDTADMANLKVLCKQASGAIVPWIHFSSNLKASPPPIEFMGQSVVCHLGTDSLNFQTSTIKQQRSEKKGLSRKLPRITKGIETESPPRSYNVMMLGGHADKVGEILIARPNWDEEAIMDLLRWGAKPPLHKIVDTLETSERSEISCVFVQPDGSLTTNVWLPISLIKFAYPNVME